ncbi:MAG: hypothetical protein L0323_14230, partial [Planctomycetes bacterium]|nr:hypothetical protein [Planctomycetota bacterium]
MERIRGPVAPRSALISVGLLALLGSTALASHFRGGWMTTSVSPSGVLTVNAVTLWAKGGSQFSDFPLGGLTRTGLVGGVYPARIDLLSGDGLRTVLRSTTNGTLPVPNIIATTTSVDQTNPNFDVRFQTFTFNLPSLGIGFGSYILYWTDAARIEGLHNVVGSQFGGSQSPFSLEACFVYDGTPRATPTIASSIITTVAQGQHYSNNLNASGTAPLSYAFIVGNAAPRYGPSFQVPGLTV